MSDVHIIPVRDESTGKARPVSDKVREAAEQFASYNRADAWVRGAEWLARHVDEQMEAMLLEDFGRVSPIALTRAYMIEVEANRHYARRTFRDDLLGAQLKTASEERDFLLRKNATYVDELNDAKAEARGLVDVKQSYQRDRDAWKRKARGWQFAFWVMVVPALAVAVITLVNLLHRGTP